MQLLKNPVTYLLLGFGLLAYVPFLFSGLLALFAYEFAGMGAAGMTLWVLAGIFFLAFLFAATYIQSLFFSYAHQQAQGKLLDVFSGARTLFWRVVLFDFFVLILALPAGLALEFTTYPALAVAWLVALALVLSSAPAHLENHSAWKTLQRSVVSFHTVGWKASVRMGAAALLAAGMLLLLAVSSLKGVGVGAVLEVLATTTSVIAMGIVSFIPLLLVSGFSESLAIVFVGRVLTLGIALVALHFVVATIRKSA